MLYQGKKYCIKFKVKKKKCHEGRKCYIKVEYCLIKVENVFKAENAWSRCVIRLLGGRWTKQMLEARGSRRVQGHASPGSFEN